MDIEAEYVRINTYHELVPGLPFGRYKQSGRTSNGADRSRSEGGLEAER